MRISDWSSDVCSSDLAPETRRKPPLRELRPGRRVAAMFQPNPPAAFACRPDESRGRDLAEPESPTRSCFQRDRDRIVHAGAFRRLKYKTQVFVYHRSESVGSGKSVSVRVTLGWRRIIKKKKNKINKIQKH